MANNLLPVIVYGPDEEGNHTRVLERFDHDPSRGSYDDLAASAREQGKLRQSNLSGRGLQTATRFARLESMYNISITAF